MQNVISIAKITCSCLFDKPAGSSVQTDCSHAKF